MNEFDSTTKSAGVVPSWTGGGQEWDNAGELVRLEGT